MTRLIVVLSLAAAALSGCAQLKDAFTQNDAHAGTTGIGDTRPYPSSSSNLGLF